MGHVCVTYVTSSVTYIAITRWVRLPVTTIIIIIIYESTVYSETQVNLLLEGILFNFNPTVPIDACVGFWTPHYNELNCVVMNTEIDARPFAKCTRAVIPGSCAKFSICYTLKCKNIRFMSLLSRIHKIAS